MDKQYADLREQFKQSSVMIASLAKTVQFNSEELKECKRKVKVKNEQLLKQNRELKERVKNQERHRMQWSPRVTGLKEKKDLDIRAQIVRFMSKIVPEMESKMEEAVDIVHSGEED